MKHAYVLVLFICLCFVVSAQDITHTLGTDGQFFIKSESGAELLNVNRKIINHSDLIFKTRAPITPVLRSAMRVINC